MNYSIPALEKYLTGLKTIINHYVAMLNIWPHLLGVSPKGINQHLEDNLRALAGDPEGQVKNTLVHDSQLLRELFERGLLTGSLWEVLLKKNVDLKTYSAFNGDLMKHFESKAEFKSWLAKQSPEVQKAAYSQFQKSKGQK